MLILIIGLIILSLGISVFLNAASPPGVKDIIKTIFDAIIIAIILGFVFWLDYIGG
jgi:hypothetical protein